MKIKRRVLGGLLLAVAVGFTAIPGSAAKPVPVKTYGISVSPSSDVPAGVSVVFTVTLTNTSPGNSNFSSFRLNSPTTPGAFVITNAAFGSGNSNPNASAVIQTTSSSVSVTYLDAVKANQHVTLAVTATTPTVPGCSAVNFSAWAATVWTGGNLSGDLFIKDVSSGLTGTLKGSCVTINVTKYNDVNVNGTQDGGESGLSGWIFTVTETGASDTTDTDGLASLTVPAGDSYEVCETAQEGWANSEPGSLCQTVAATDTTSGATIDLTFGNWATDGVLGCVDGNNTSGVVSGGTEGQQSEATLVRGTNGDGSDCVLIPYNLDVFTDHVILRKDLTGQETARFELTITWGVPFEYGQRAAEFDLDGDPDTTADNFTPDSCVVVDGEAQYPVNPDGSGNYWPAGTAEQPWCVAAVTVVPVGDHLEVTETYLGSGDPTIRYK